MAFAFRTQCRGRTICSDQRFYCGAHGSFAPGSKVLGFSKHKVLRRQVRSYMHCRAAIGGGMAPHSAGEAVGAGEMRLLRDLLLLYPSGIAASALHRSTTHITQSTQRSRRYNIQPCRLVQRRSRHSPAVRRYHHHQRGTHCRATLRAASL